MCPCYRLADKGEITVIPWYLILGRPYPLQVYQFACSYYSSNPEIGQRGAAEATREKFGLKTFSHSTVSRSMKTFDQARKAAMEKKYGEEIIVSDAEGVIIVSAAPKGANDDGSEHLDTDESPRTRRRFPSVSDTANRREAVAGFLPKFEKDAKREGIEAAGCQFAKNWNETARRLLL